MNPATTAKTLKAIHTLASVGIMGALGAILIIRATVSPSDGLTEQIQVRLLVGDIARWMLLPSLVAMILSGMLSMLIGPIFYKAGWVWMKLALGLSMFEGTLLTVQGPAQKAAEMALKVQSGSVPPEQLMALPPINQMAIIILLGVSTTAIIFGVFRPRFERRT